MGAEPDDNPDVPNIPTGDGASWAALAADSHVPPAPRYLYTVQAVLGEDGQVWLHSHGLNRCNVPELEVLGSTRENYEQHYYVIETMANRLLERGEPLAPGEPLFLARLSEEAVLVTTLLPWEEAVHLYDEDILGGRDDRQDGHNEDTSCIFTYPSEEDLEKRQICPLTVYDKLLSENPVYMISTAETERMTPEMWRQRCPFSCSKELKNSAGLLVRAITITVARRR